MLFGPGVLEGYRAVEDRALSGHMVPAVRHKVAQALKLAVEFGFHPGQGGFQLGSGDDGQGAGIHDGEESVFCRVRVFLREQAVVDADFPVHGGC